jgi:hypothetical protein|tara:strand:- start:133 stop:351 length:219 start_codon:yes stop_codon:yes gene_type:complete
MKQYYTLKLKLTPKQIEMLSNIFDMGKLSVSDQWIFEENPAEENRLMALENKIDQTMKDSGYNDDWYNNRTA